MSPRIRSFFARPPYAREAKSPAQEAPRVFREFVETLQRLDPPVPARRGHRARRRRNLGNGHAHPHPTRRRRPR